MLAEETVAWDAAALAWSEGMALKGDVVWRGAAASEGDVV